MKKARQIYSSPNGDRWYLISDPSGTVFIRHEANAEAGGHVTHTDVATFLSYGQGPEQQALVRLIATLADNHPHD